MAGEAQPSLAISSRVVAPVWGGEGPGVEPQVLDVQFGEAGGGASPVPSGVERCAPQAFGPAGPVVVAAYGAPQSSPPADPEESGLRFSRRAAVTAAAAGVAILGCAAMADAASATRSQSGAHVTRPSAVLGYVEDGDGLAVLRRDLPGVTSIGVDGVNVSRTGGAVSQPDVGALAMLAAAHRAGKSAQLLVGNYSDSIDDFDPAIAHRLLTSAAKRRSVTAALVADADQGWDGIQLDLESLDASDMVGLDQFTEELRAALPATKSLSMAVMASTAGQGYRADGYDLPVLWPQLAQVVLMAYDQHGPTWTSAGPVGGLPWSERAVDAMLKSVPPARVVLGVAGYGYTWPEHGIGVQLSDAVARRFAPDPVWDARQGEWHSPLRGGGTEWWSDTRSLRIREGIVLSAHLQGVAVWSLGLSDRLSRLPAQAAR